MSKEDKIISANELIKELRKHSVWNTEGVIQIIDKLPTVEALKISFGDKKK